MTAITFVVNLQLRLNKYLTYVMAAFHNNVILISLSCIGVVEYFKIHLSIFKIFPHCLFKMEKSFPMSSPMIFKRSKFYII